MRKSLSAKNKKRIDEDKSEDEIIEEVLDDNESDDAETAPNFVEGDIAIPEVKSFNKTSENSSSLFQGKSRLAIDFDRFPAKKWKNNTVPYRISRNHSE